MPHTLSRVMLNYPHDNPIVDMTLNQKLGKLSRTKVFDARPGSASMKGTIPDDVVSALKLKHGDEIDWEITAEGGEIVIKVRKVKARRVS